MASQTVTRRLQVIIDESGAGKTLDRLKVKEQELIDKIKKGEQAGRDMTAELNRLGTVQQQVQQLEGVISGQLTPSLRQTRAAVQNLRRELEGMSQDAPGYAERLAAFNTANTQLTEMTQNVTGFRSAATSAFSEVKKIVMGVSISNAFEALVSGVGGYIVGLVSGAGKLSDELADVEKATGKTTEEVASLNSELGKINTRTATAELRKIAVALGQLGEDASAASVAAIDQIVVALGDEFGGGADEITKTVSVLRNNLQDLKTGNYADDVTKIANALNELGANGLATAPVVTDVANRVAGVASTFGITSGQVLGLAATFEELGINTERGSTAYTKLLQKMATDTSTFAKVAGMSVEDFTKLVNTDMQAAFVKVAEGAKTAGNSNTKFAAILSDLESTGAGVSELLAKIGNNSQLLQQKTDLATNSLKNNNSILSEFAKKNNTLGAELEKLGKRIAGFFSSSVLTKFLTDAVTGFNNLITPAKTATDLFKEQEVAVNNLEKNITPLIQRYDELKSKAVLNKDEQVELNNAIKTIGETIPGAVTQFDNYGRALGINTKAARDFIALQKDILKEKNRDAITEESEKLVDLEKQLKVNFGQLATFQKEYTRINDVLANSPDDKNKANSSFVKTLEFYGNGINSLSKKIQVLQSRISGIRGQIKLLSGEPLVDVAAAPAAVEKTEVATAVIDKDAEAKRRKAEEEAKRRAEELRKLLADIQKMEQGIYAKSADSYAAALADISFKYEDIIARAETTVFKSAKQKLATRKRILQDFVAELQIVDKKFAEPEPGRPVDKNAPNQKKIDIDREQAAAAATNRKNERLAKLELDFIKAIGKEKLAAELALLDEQMLQEIAASKYGENEILLIKEKYLQKKNELRKSFLDKEIKASAEEVEHALEVGQQVVSIGSSINDILNQQDNQRLESIRNNHTKEQEGYKTMLDQKFLSQSQYDKKITASNKKLAAEEKKIAKQQFDRNKAISLAQAVIATALAVTKSIPNYYQMALSAALGAIQIAAIATQRAPEFAKGGFVPNGSSHAEGGLGIRDNRTGHYLGTMEGGEPIISKGVYVANRPVIDALLAKGYNRDFTPITPQWMTRQPMRMNIPLISQSVAASSRPRFADGGISPNTYAEGGQRQEQILQAILVAVSRDKQAYVSANEVRDMLNMQDSIRDSGTIS